MESLPSAERTALLELGHRRDWQQGEVLIRAGEPGDSAIVVLG